MSNTIRVAELRDAGRTPAEIADALGLSVAGVHYHLRKLATNGASFDRRPAGLIARLRADVDQELERLDAQIDQARAHLLALEQERGEVALAHDALSS